MKNEELINTLNSQTEIDRVNTVVAERAVMELINSLDELNVEWFEFPEGKNMWPIYVFDFKTTRKNVGGKIHTSYERGDMCQSTKIVRYTPSRMYLISDDWIFVHHEHNYTDINITTIGFVTTLSNLEVKIPELSYTLSITEWLSKYDV